MSEPEAKSLTASAAKKCYASPGGSFSNPDGPTRATGLLCAEETANGIETDSDAAGSMRYVALSV